MATNDFRAQLSSGSPEESSWQEKQKLPNMRELGQHTVILRNKLESCQLSRSAPEHLMQGMTAEDDDVYASRSSKINMKLYSSTIKPPPAGKFRKSVEAVNRIVRGRSGGDFTTRHDFLQPKAEEKYDLTCSSQHFHFSNLVREDPKSQGLSAIWELLTTIWPESGNIRS
jgi:hypothetical protein